MAEVYKPESPPNEEAPALAQYVFRELERASILMELMLEGFFPETFVEPAKPRTGDIRLADGTSWNPGSGRGVYWYDGDAPAWTKL